MTVTRLTHKPIILEGIQFDGSIESAVQIEVLSKGLVIPTWRNGEVIHLQYCTGRDNITVSKGYWVIKKGAGEISVCKPEDFSALYDIQGESQ